MCFLLLENAIHITMRQLKIIQQITRRDTASLDKYLSEIAKVDLITAEEEVLLARRIKMGDQEALNKLTKANLRFVVSVAKQYQNQGLSLPDLINEGNLGLIKAAHRFDESRGFKFISYAVWWIRQSILQALAEHARIVRLPLNKIGSIQKLNKSYAHLEQELEREPLPEELAALLDISTDEVNNSIRISSHQVSLDAPISNSDDERNMYDVLTTEDSNLNNPENGLIHESLRFEIERSLKTLSNREAEIIKFFYGICGYAAISLDEIGLKFDLTKERVRQIRDKGLRRLQFNSRAITLKAFLG